MTALKPWTLGAFLSLSYMVFESSYIAGKDFGNLGRLMFGKPSDDWLVPPHEQHGDRIMSCR